jgi:hypothetical protein
MKICSHCQNTYTDDSLQFCLQDGTQLSAVGSSTQDPTLSWNTEPETLLRKNPMPTTVEAQQAAPSQTLPAGQTIPEAPKKSNTWLLVLVVIFFFLAIATIGGVGALMYFGSNNNGPVVQNINTNPNNAEVNKNANANLTPPPTPTPTPKPTLKPAELETAKKEVESVIYGWKSTAENHNLEANLSNYAETVDYYKGGKLNKSKLKASKEPAYKRYDSISIEISNLKVAADPTGEKATVTLDKEWDFSGTDENGNEVFNSGKVQQQLVLNKINGKWKIVSEKDVKVYYVDKGNTDNTDDYQN